MHRATKAASNSFKLGGDVPSIDSLIIIKKSMDGTPISPARRWKVRVMGDHLSTSTISKALLAGTIGRVRKRSNPMALTLSCTLEHIWAHNLKTLDHDPWCCTFSLAYKKNELKCVRTVFGSKKNKKIKFAKLSLRPNAWFLSWCQFSILTLDFKPDAKFLVQHLFFKTDRK